AAYDHVFLPIHERQIAFFIQNADIAGMKPAIAHGFRSRFRTLVVALHDVMATYDDFAFFARRNGLLLVIHAHDVHAPQRLAHRTRPGGPVHMVEAYDGRGFR